MLPGAGTCGEQATHAEALSVATLPTRKVLHSTGSKGLPLRVLREQQLALTVHLPLGASLPDVVLHGLQRAVGAVPAQLGVLHSIHQRRASAATSTLCHGGSGGDKRVRC